PGPSVAPTASPDASAQSRERRPRGPHVALAAGLAVVATDVPGHRDVVGHETTGLLVAPEAGAVALATAIESLLDDPDRRRRMGQAGRARVVEEVTLQPMGAEPAEDSRAAAPRTGRRPIRTWHVRTP